MLCVEPLLGISDHLSTGQRLLEVRDLVLRRVVLRDLLVGTTTPLLPEFFEERRVEPLVEPLRGPTDLDGLDERLALPRGSLRDVVERADFFLLA